ncbi:FAD binding domain-containing protein [Rhodovibrionaceae bacterium A322]
MYNFNYHRPSSADDAVSAVSSADEGKFLAGGMTLLPTMKQRLAAPSDVVDLAGVSGLSGVTDGGDHLVIGAMTTHADVASNATVQAKLPALAALAGGIGDPQVRHRGTIGGSVANADPAADYPSAVLGLGATIKTSKREIAADDFFVDLFETALEEDEMILSISFPLADKAAYVKFPNPASRYAIVGVFVAQGPAGTRVAVTGAGPSAFRVSDMESALAGNLSASALSGIAVSADNLNSDIHASAAYRAHLISVMAKRAVNAL